MIRLFSIAQRLTLFLMRQNYNKNCGRKPQTNKDIVSLFISGPVVTATKNNKPKRPLSTKHAHSQV